MIIYFSSFFARNKQVPAERLAIAGLAVAYNMEQYPTNGPFPTQINRARCFTKSILKIIFS